MINNIFWLGQAPIGELSGDGVVPEVPLDHPSHSLEQHRQESYSIHPSLPLRVSDRWLRFWIVHTCTTITHCRCNLVSPGMKSYDFQV